MSKKKKIKGMFDAINSAEYSQELLKNPAETIAKIITKNGKIKASKKTKKLVKQVCPHMTARGRKLKNMMRPDGNGNVRCKICGDVIRPKFFSKEEAHARTKKELEMVSQGKLAAQALGLPSKNVMDIAMTYIAVDNYEKTYNNMAEAVNKRDRIKNKKKNKNNGAKSYGSWE